MGGRGKRKGPKLGTRGLHSEAGGGRGLTAWDAVCYARLAVSEKDVQYYLLNFEGARTPEVRGVGVPKIKAPSWVTRGLHSEGGGGRGLTAWDAVCWLYSSNLGSCCPELFWTILNRMRARWRKGPEAGKTPSKTPSGAIESLGRARGTVGRIPDTTTLSDLVRY